MVTTSPTLRGFRTSIRLKILLGVLVAAIAPLAIVAFTSSFKQEEVALQVAFERLEGLASAEVAQLENMVESDREIGQLLATNTSVAETLALDGSDSAEAASVLDMTVRDIDRVQSAALVLANRTVVYSTNPALVSRFAAIPLSSDSAADFVGRVIAGESAQPVHLVSNDVVVAGEVVGTVVLELDLAPLAALATDYVGLGRTGETSIAQLTADGSAEFVAPLRFRDDAVLNMRVPASATTAPITLALAGVDGRFGDVIDYRGESVLAVTRQVPGSGWGLVVKIDRSEALDGVASFRGTLIGAAIVGALIVLAFALLLARWVGKPVRGITQAAVSVAGGDLTARAAVAGRDEFGELASAVNTMTDGLVDAAAAEAGRTAELEALNEQLVDSEARVRAVVDNAADGIITCDARGLVQDINRAAEEMLGWMAEEAVGYPLTRMLAFPDAGGAWPDPTMSLLEQAWRRSGEAVRMAGRRPDDTTVPLRVSVSRLTVGGEESFTGVLRDESERVAFERRLSDMATRDPLTGLANRGHFSTCLEEALESAASSEAVGLLFIDLDRFKMVNDAWGHASGDELIRAVARRLSGVLRQEDVLARFGGDEFVILATGRINLSVLESLGERILRALERPFRLGDNTTYVSASIGIAISHDSDALADDLLSQADVAMYRAKSEGRNQVAIYDHHMRSSVQARHTLDTDLRLAIDERQLDVHYQPIVQLDNGQFCGVEALVRWSHPDRGPISPGEFIPAAEESGLIVPLGRLVLETAVNQLAVWQREHPETEIQLAVNLSAREVMQNDCVETVLETLARAGAVPERLTLEVTESALMTDAARAIENLQRLHDAGIKIALDDFGTGYSSLTYLRDLPVDVVKIDRSFVQELERPGSDLSITALVLDLGDRMNLCVVAEGIETPAQHETLVQLGGLHAQGYFYARPQPAEHVEALLWPEPALDLVELES